MKLTELAKQEITVAEGEIEHAITALIRLAKTDEEIRNELIYIGASTLINQANQQYRSSVIYEKAIGDEAESAGSTVNLYEKQTRDREDGIVRSSERAKSIGMIVQRSLMNLTFKVRGKTFMLGDANRELLEETSSWYIDYGRNMQRRGKWLEAIANGLEGSETVQEKYSETDLQNLLDNSRVI